MHKPEMQAGTIRMMLMVTRPDKGSFTVAAFIDLDMLDIL